jgi:hypothetical protein
MVLLCASRGSKCVWQCVIFGLHKSLNKLHTCTNRLVQCVNCFQLDLYNVYTYHDQILLNEEGTLTVLSRLSYHLQTAG